MVIISTVSDPYLCFVWYDLLSS